MNRSERAIITYIDDNIRCDRDADTLMLVLPGEGGRLRQVFLTIEEAKRVRQMLGQVLNEPHIVLASGLSES